MLWFYSRGKRNVYLEFGAHTRWNTDHVGETANERSCFRAEQTNHRLNHVLGVSSPQETGPLLQEMVLFKSEEATWIERQHTWRPLAQRKHQNIRGTVRGPWIHSRMSPAPNHQNKRPWTIIRVKMHKCRNSFKHLKGTNTKLMISSGTFKTAHPSPPRQTSTNLTHESPYHIQP